MSESAFSMPKHSHKFSIFFFEQPHYFFSSHKTTTIEEESLVSIFHSFKVIVTKSIDFKMVPSFTIFTTILISILIVCNAFIHPYPYSIIQSKKIPSLSFVPKKKNQIMTKLSKTTNNDNNTTNNNILDNFVII